MGRRFLGLTALWAEGCGIAYGAALRPGFKGFRRFKGFRGCGIALAGDEFYRRSAAAANRRHYNSPLNQPGRRSRSRAEPIGQCDST